MFKNSFTIRTKQFVETTYSNRVGTQFNEWITEVGDVQIVDIVTYKLDEEVVLLVFYKE